MPVTELMQSFLLLSLIAFLGLIINRILRLELSLSSLLAGIIGSLIVMQLNMDTGIRAANAKDLIFYIVLPLLIFVSAWNLNAKQFKRWFFICFALATLGMMASIGLTAAGVYYAIAHQSGFPWIAAFLVATILSATDPVSVSAQLKRSETSEELQTLFEGESLLNDASVIVLFGVLLTYAQGQVPEHNALVSFLVVFFGGLVFGALLGLVSAIFTLFINDKSASVIIMILASFGGFFVAESILHVSGIMTVMASAIIARVLLKDQHKDLLSDLGGTFNWIGLFLNAIIFSLMGLLVTLEMLTHQWLAIIIGIVATLLARFIMVHSLALLTSKSRRQISNKWALLLSWGGQKGLIAIALVLSLPVSLSYWWTIQSMVFGVVLFSLVVQATSFPWLLHLLEKKVNNNNIN